MGQKNPGTKISKEEAVLIVSLITFCFSFAVKKEVYSK